MKECIGVVMAFLLMVPAIRAEETTAVPDGNGLERLRAQVETERRKEEELGLLQLEVERLKLEVEKKKAVVELGRLPGGADTGEPYAGNAAPVMSLRYIFMAKGKDSRKTAVFDIDGTEHRVEEGGEISGRVVKSIALEEVILKSKDGRDTAFTPGK